MDEFRSDRNPFSAPGSRAGRPVENIEVGDELTTCGYCGARTEWDSRLGDHPRRETCINCRQRYNVEDAPDDDISADDLFVCAKCGRQGDIEDSVAEIDLLLCAACADPLAAAEADRVDTLASKAAKGPPYDDFGKF
jgi:DNA-directed RNA polymerase subunit RPC12/RpoP